VADSQQVAMADSWKTVPASENFVPLDFTALFLDVEIDQLMKGLVPVSMEDKWFIHFQDGCLYIYRSWSGKLIYRVTFRQRRSKAFEANAEIVDDPDVYSPTSLEYESEFLNFLIQSLLLGKKMRFPIPRTDRNPKGTLQHNLIGRAFPEVRFPKEGILQKLRRILLLD